MTPTEALARIEALCDDRDGVLLDGVVDTDDVRAVLAQVQAEPVDLDLDEARDVLREQFPNDPDYRIEFALDALAACVRPAPPQAIDRDTLEKLLTGLLSNDSDWYPREEADRILALLRPVEGVVLTREEAAIALSWYPGGEYAVSLRHAKVAERLEAAS